VVELLDALAVRDAKRVLTCVADLDERVPDYQGVLAEMAALLQRIALVQSVPDFTLDDAEDAEAMSRLSKAFSPEDVQLNYQIALIGRRDLDLAPDARGGFEMVLLRMLAFQPARESAGEQTTLSNRMPRNAPMSPTPKPAAAPSGATAGDEWASIVARLGLQGPASQLAAHCSLIAKEGARIRLLLDSAGDLFRRPALEEQLARALAVHFDEAIKLDIEIGAAAQAVSIDTPARRQQVQAQDRLQAARASIESDPNIQAMRDIFGATVQPESIKPN